MDENYNALAFGNYWLFSMIFLLLCLGLPTYHIWSF